MTVNTLTYSKGVNHSLLGIFDDALRISGCTPGEVIHIGDSYDTDMVEAHGTVIMLMLLLRERARRHDDTDAADGLDQALELFFPKG